MPICLLYPVSSQEHTQAQGELSISIRTKTVLHRVDETRETPRKEGYEPTCPYDGLRLIARCCLLNLGAVLRRRGQLHGGNRPSLFARTSDRKSTRLNSSHANISYAV